MRPPVLVPSRLRSGLVALMGFGAAFAVAAVKPAEAVPAFAMQTGYPCQQCHIGALGPQLTPFGRGFKIKGYTIRGGEGLASHIPLALWVQSGFENSQKAQAPGNVPPHFNNNDNADVDAISLFIAGGVNQHLGAFIQITYDNTAKALAEDNTDIRVVDTVQVLGKDTDIGLSFNNAPSLSDPYNSNYIWGYPFIGEFYSPASNAGTILSGRLQSNSYGVNAYAWWNDTLYLDAGLYETQSPGMMKLLGEAYDPGSATGVEPYLAATYAYFWGNNNVHLGGVFFEGRFNPNNPNTVSSYGTVGNYGHDKYYDFMVDNGYQYMGDDDVNIFTVDGYYVYEIQDLEGSVNRNPDSPYFVGPFAYQPHNNLQEFRETGTYYYRQTYGATISFDSIWGKKNQFLYNTGAPQTGSINGSPNTTLVSMEADWVPFGKENSFLRPYLNWKLGLKYTMYTKFNGGTTNYDGYGRNASDNNTIFLFLWTVF
jgi:hypothetical protein